jgi:putative Mn2+ efflux pump MntP
MTSIALSLDAFAVSVSCGITKSASSHISKLKLASFFGFFQGMMPAAAYFLAGAIKVDLGAFTGPVAFVILLVIGFHMIRESFKKEEECGYGELTIKRLLALSIATSIDAFATGISLSLLDINIWPAVIMIASITFCISLAGVYFGCKIGDRIKNGAELTGGIILILIGLKILIEGLI